MSGVLDKHELDVLPRLELQTMDAYWRAANYLSVGQIYLYDNPLLKKPLGKEHVKPRLLATGERHRV
jgi:xylulose-5-phosphate/fructose-6-phosphate phosphoketolase